MKVDLSQGQDEQGRDFGYVHGDDGGYFFTWRDSLASTIDSLEADSIEGDGGLDADEVAAMLRRYLPATSQGQAMWSS